VPSLVRLINRAYEVEAFFVRGERTNVQDVQARMSRPGSTFLVVDAADGALAGAIHVTVQGDRGGVAMLSVEPSRQKGGLGRMLVSSAEEHCRAAGCRFLDLDVVNLRRELPAFYRRLGFAPCGTARFHDPEKLTRPAHLILMTKPLVDLWA
jgi:GNAT superfamily N-acetyltransferase